jgi:BirA family biotin operon repressor/biotin-[acetyl-CoA-carboxylase] ligase
VEKNIHSYIDHHKGVLIEEDSLRPECLREALKSTMFSKNIRLFESTDSTNGQAKELCVQGAPEGTLVLAEQQTAGRGRRGRTWQSPGRVNLLLSIVLRPPIEPERAFVLTMILALAAGDGVSDICGLRPMIKWPNDLYVRGRKLAGILTEFSVRENGIEYMVLGMGLNVNWDPDENPDILNPATSLMREMGRRINREDLLVRIMKHFDESYKILLSGKIMGFYRKWNKRSMVLGQEVEVESDGKTLRGTARKIDNKGALILRDFQGVERVILNGDVSLRY